MKTETGYIAEIFPAIQGEGLDVGKHQLFIRMAGCSYDCSYCDTVWARKKEPDKAKVLFTPFSENQISVKNPFTAEELFNLVEKLLKKCGPISELAITGGEPLEQSGFLYEFLRLVKKNHEKMSVMLETNGINHDALQAVSRYINTISMDIKLRSTSGKSMPVKKIRSFMEATVKINGWVKVVVSSTTSAREIIHAAKLIHKILPDKEMIIQPAMRGRKQFDVRLSHCFNLLRTASNYHDKVRLIPQLHKLTGMA